MNKQFEFGGEIYTTNLKNYMPYRVADIVEAKIRADERAKVLDAVKKYIDSRVYYDNHRMFIDATSHLNIITEIEGIVEEQENEKDTEKNC